MSAQRNLTDQEYELLSGYLDGALSDPERAELEARLAAESDLREELEALRQTVLLVKSVPQIRAPRRFTLTADMVRAPRWIIFPTTAAFSALSAAAAMLFIFIGATLLLGQSSQAIFSNTASSFQREQDTQSQVAVQPTDMATGLPEQAAQPEDIALASAIPPQMGGQDASEAYDDETSLAATSTSDGFSFEVGVPGTPTPVADQFQFSPAVPQPTQVAEPAEEAQAADGITAQEAAGESEAANAPGAAMADTAAQNPIETASSDRDAATTAATMTFTSTLSPTASNTPAATSIPTETITPPTVAPTNAPVPQPSGEQTARPGNPAAGRGAADRSGSDNLGTKTKMSERTANFCPKCGARLEIYDRSGAMRPVCPDCDYTVYFDPKVAVVVFIRENDHVLLVKRAGDPKKGYWAMPAGFVEAGEDPQEAARREALEETCLEVTIDRLLDVFYTAGDGGMADIVIAYEARIVSGTPTAADDAEEVGWFTRVALPELAFLPSQRLAARWLAGEYD